MKTCFYLFTVLLVMLLSIGCEKEDDNGDTDNGMDDLRFTLTWGDNPDPQTNVDFNIQVNAPGPSVCTGMSCVANDGTASGDDTSGPGEEIIFFDNNAPDGDYVVIIDLLADSGPHYFDLLIESAGSSMMFTDSLIGDMGDSDSVVEFTKNGPNISF